MKKYYAIIGPAALVILWEIIVRIKLVNSFLFPGPAATFSKLWQLISGNVILGDLASTLERVVIAFAIAVAIGLPLGLLLGRSEKLYRSLEFLIDFFRSTPSTALFPLFLLVFGVTDKSKIAVAAFASMLIVIFNTAYGVMNAKKSRVLAAEIMGATKLQIFFHVLFWESLPQIFIGLRSAISLSLVVIIVTEMFIGTASGLGRKIIDFQIVYEIKGMYAVIILCGITGYLLNLFFLVLEKKLLHWNSR